MRRVTIGVAVVVSALISPTGASGVTFGEWASSQGHSPGAVMPSQVDATSASIDSLSGVGDYDWTSTPTTELILANNELTSIGLSDFSGLTSLTHLSLSRNDISTLQSGGIGDLANLNTLRLNGNDLVTVESDLFSRLTNLTDLLLNGNDLVSIESGAFNGLPNLRLLWLQNNKELTKLNLAETEFSSLDFFSVADNVNMTSVSLKNTVVNQDSLASLLNGGNENHIGIGELDGITELDLSGVDFGNITDLSPLYLMDDLTDLRLAHTGNLDPAGLDLWLDNLETIEGTDSEGTLYMTQIDFDTFNTAGGGLLATWDAEPGHHVEIVLPGDFDLDDDVDGADFLKWQRGESPEPLSQSDLGDWEIDYGTVSIQQGDFNGNGVVNGHDFLKWQLDPSVGSLADWESNYGTLAALSAFSAAVPEPTTSALALAALCLVMSRRRSF